MTATDDLQVATDIKIRRLTWAVVGTVLLGVTGWLVQIKDLYKWVFPDGPALVAAVSSDDISLPDNFWENVAVLEKVTNADTPQTPESGIVENFRPLVGKISLSIRNAGNLIANDVRLVIGRKGIAEIKWDDGKIEIRKFETDLPIGDLPLEKSVRVTAWVEESMPSTIILAHTTDTETFDTQTGSTGGGISLATAALAGILGGCLSAVGSRLLVARRVANIESMIERDFSDRQLALNERKKELIRSLSELEKARPTAATDALSGEPQSQSVNDQPEP